MGKIMINGKDASYSSNNANNIKYDNSASELSANNVQDAIDNTIEKINTKYSKPSDGIPASDLANGVIPTTLPASDVKAWAKADTKPTYTASEVGALPSTTTHLSGDIASSEKGVANGVATLDTDGKIPSSQLPSDIDGNTTYTFFEGTTDGAFTVTPSDGTTQTVYVHNANKKLTRSGSLSGASGVDGFIEANNIKFAKFSNYSDIGFEGDDGMLLSIPWSSTASGSQLAFDDSKNPLMKIRGKSSSGWGDWKQIAYTDDPVKIPTLTQAEYDALTDKSGTYLITDQDDMPQASEITFNNSDTGLSATNVQSAISEVKANAGLLPEIAIPTNANLNTLAYCNVGRYYCALNNIVATLSNCPTTNAFVMEVYSPLNKNTNISSTGDVYRVRKILDYKGFEYIQYIDIHDNTPTYHTWRKKLRADDIDTALSTSSTNAVQNKVVATALNGKQATLTVTSGTATWNTTYGGTASAKGCTWVKYGKLVIVNVYDATFTTSVKSDGSTSIIASGLPKAAQSGTTIFGQSNGTKGRRASVPKGSTNLVWFWAGTATANESGYAGQIIYICE